MAGHTNGTGNGHDIAQAQASLAKSGIMPADSAMEALQDEGRAPVRRIRGQVLKALSGPSKKWAAAKNATLGLVESGGERPPSLERDVGYVRTFLRNVAELREHYSSSDMAPHKNQQAEKKLAELEKLEAAFSVAAASALTRHVIIFVGKPAAANAAVALLTDHVLTLLGKEPERKAGDYFPILGITHEDRGRMQEIFNAIKPNDLTREFTRRIAPLLGAKANSLA